MTESFPKKKSGLFLQVDGEDCFVFEIRGEGENNAGETGIIGGGVEEDETSIQAIRREITEETGLDPDSLGIEEVTELLVEGNEGDQLAYSIFRGIIPRAMLKDVVLTEAAGLREIPGDELRTGGNQEQLTKVARQVVEYLFKREDL